MFEGLFGQYESDEKVSGLLRLMRALRILTVLSFTLLSVAGCSVIHYRSKGLIPLSFSKLPGGNSRKVVIEKRMEFYLFGFLPETNEVFVDEEIKIAGHESMSNLKIEERTTWKDWLFGIFTLGFYVPRSFFMSGLVPERRRNIQ